MHGPLFLDQSTMKVCHLYKPTLCLLFRLLTVSLAIAADQVQAAVPSTPAWSSGYVRSVSPRWRKLWESHMNNSSATAEPVASPCDMYGLQKKPKGDGYKDARRSEARVVDCFLASNELDMMEIRLRELEAVVDTFVIVESRMTFRGNPKPLRYPSLMQRLPATAINKVVYHVIDDLEGGDTWAREIYQVSIVYRYNLLTTQAYTLQ